MKREYLSASALNAFLKSPNHYLAYVSKEIKPTPAMIFGSALHCRILEPEEFENRYAVAPKIDRRTKAGKEAWQGFQMINQGKEILSEIDAIQIETMKEKIDQDPIARDLLDHCLEYEIEKIDSRGKIPMKGIADGLGSNFVVDLKTTQDSSPEKFKRSAFSFGYHIQAAIYRRIFDVDKFFWIAIEKDAPFNIMIFEQGQKARQMSDEFLDRAIDRFIAWDGSPGSYESGIIDLDFPAWA